MPRSYLNLDTIIQSHYPLNYLESNFSLNNYNTVAPNRPFSPKNLSKRGNFSQFRIALLALTLALLNFARKYEDGL